MLADALKPYGGIVMWRAFVYSPTDSDRAKQAYLDVYKRQVGALVVELQSNLFFDDEADGKVMSIRPPDLRRYRYNLSLIHIFVRLFCKGFTQIINESGHFGFTENE